MQTLAGFLLIVIGVLGFIWEFKLSRNDDGVVEIIIRVMAIVAGLYLFGYGIYPVISLLK